MRTPLSLDELNQFIGCQLSEEILLGRNYFLGQEGYLEKYNENVKLIDFPDLDEPIMKAIDDDGNVEAGPNSSVTVMNHINYTLFQDDCENGEEDGEAYWHKCLAANPEDIECECYIIIRISVDDSFKITDIKLNARFVGECIGLCYMPGDDDGLESRYSTMPMMTLEVYQELKNLCSGKFLPKDFSLIGKKIN